MNSRLSFQNKKTGSHMTRPQNHSQRGNVLFYILIAVALIASLSYAVSQSSRVGGDAISDQKLELYSGGLLDYSNILSKAVAQLRLRGCQIGEISFENDIDASYTNGAAPDDNSCHVFHPNGGGVNVQPIQDDAFLATAPGYFFGASMQVQDVGSTCSGTTCVELLFLARDLKSSICLKINDIMGITNPSGAPPIETALDFTAFTGTYTNEETIGDVTASADVAGKRSGCVEDDSTGQYHFYKVLLRR
jgi:hypothetical protein